MALHIHYKKKINGVNFISGYCYQFNYQAWNADPRPTYIHMYAFTGTHPKTGRQWRFIQGLNMTYLPRVMRKAFAQDWIKQMKRTNGNAKLTWQIIQQRYPYAGAIATRRYFYSPNYYLYKIKPIPFEQFEEVVVSTYAKDFSKKVKISLLQKFSSSWKARKKVNKKAKEVQKKYGFFGKPI